MDKSALIFEILEKYWTDECDAVGPTNVEDIVEGEVSYESAEGGSYIDLGEVITILAAAATFIRNVIDIYKSLEQDKKKFPDDEDLKLEARKKKLESEDIDEETKNKIYKEISEKLAKSNSEED